MHHIHQIRRYLRQSLIVLLALAALLAIYVLITGDLGWLEIKSLLSAFIAFAAGLNGLTCALCRHQLRRHWLAWLGVGLGSLSALLLLIQLWANVQSPLYWKLCGLALTWTLTYTHSLLTVMVELDGWRQRLLIPATRACGIALGLLTSVALLAEVYNSLLIRSFSVLAILTGFCTLMLVLLHRRHLPLTPRLVLQPLPDGLYRDVREGRLYKVSPADE